MAGVPGYCWARSCWTVRASTCCRVSGCQRLQLRQGQLSGCGTSALSGCGSSCNSVKANDCNATIRAVRDLVGNARAVPTCSSHRAANDNGHPSAGRLALLSAASARAVAYYELAELRAAQCATTQPTPRHPVPAVAQQCVARCSLTCHGWQRQPHWVVYYVLCSIRH